MCMNQNDPIFLIQFAFQQSMQETKCMQRIHFLCDATLSAHSHLSRAASLRPQFSLRSHGTHHDLGPGAFSVAAQIGRERWSRCVEQEGVSCWVVESKKSGFDMHITNHSLGWQWCRRQKKGLSESWKRLTFKREGYLFIYLFIYFSR